MAGQMDPRYAQLSPNGVPAEQQMTAPAAADPSGGDQQLVIAGADLKQIMDLKAKGNIQAIGEYIASLV